MTHFIYHLDNGHVLLPYVCSNVCVFWRKDNEPHLPPTDPCFTCTSTVSVCRAALLNAGLSVPGRRKCAVSAGNAVQLAGRAM